MDRAFASGASATPPSAPASPSVGYPSAGNPATPTNPTKPGPYWYYMITEEIRKVIVDAGLTPDQANVAQLSAAIQTMIASLVPDASTTVKGKVELATSAEAQALTDALRALTPATLAGAFQGGNQSLSANGFQKLPGGLIIQGGTVTTAAGGSASVTYPQAFPAGVIALVATPVNSLGSQAIGVVNPTSNSGFTIYCTISGAGQSHAFRWFAIGY